MIRKSILAALGLLLMTESAQYTPPSTSQEETGIEIAESEYVSREPVPSLGPSSNLETIAQDAEIPPTKTTAGNLYFRNFTTMPDSDLDKIMSNVVSNFAYAGFGFEKVEKTTGQPELNGNDILVCITPEPLRETRRKDVTGQFGVAQDGILMQPYHEKLMDMTGLSYGIHEAHAHVATVSPVESRDILEISNAATHEVAHGLGAPHLADNYCGDQKIESHPEYFMSAFRFNRNLKFHPLTAQFMASFLDETRQGNYSAQELWEKQLEYNFKCYKPDEYEDFINSDLFLRFRDEGYSPN